MELPWDRDALLASPLFESLWPVLRQCPAGRFPGLVDLGALASNRGVRGAGGTLIRFVADEIRRRGEFDSQYEIRVYREGAVPTRGANWHDLFNALAWIAFPRIKSELNRRHYEEMRSRKDGRGRGGVRDALTLFDESGVIVACAEPALEKLLREFRWKDLFWRQRGPVQRAMKFFVFGHAIEEKALRPYKGMTARALVLPVAADFFALPLEAQLEAIDAATALRLSDEQAIASTRSLSPVPVLGVPGWDPGNERESYYDDESVFRPGRTRTARK